MKRYGTVLCCFLYVCSPVDILPEVLLGPAGVPDDIVVGLIGVRKLFWG